MEWTLDKTRPICPQICERLCVLIAGGKYAPNQKLLSVREVAVAAGVNPNTVQRSFEELERQGILYSVRGSGWFVAEDISPAKQTLSRLMTEKTRGYFYEMSTLGLNDDQIKNYVKEWNQ